jgi:hypothetical protein
MPRTNGDLFAYTLDEFIQAGADTLSTLSFDSPYLGGEFAVRPSERWDIALGFGWTRSRSVTEYRRWVETDPGPPVTDFPIEQETTFQVVTGTLGAKYYLQDRGQRVGSLAWVPHRLTPFVGAGIGVSSYEFTQRGDFVDAVTTDIYQDILETDGEGFLAYAHAGVDVVLGSNVVLTGEARYTRADAAVGGSFDNFNDIDLAGLQFLVGFGFQF